MRSRRSIPRLPAAISVSLAVLAIPALVYAADPSATTGSSTSTSGSAGTEKSRAGLNTSGSSAGRQATGEASASSAGTGRVDKDTRKDAQKQVQQAADVVQRMQKDPDVKALISQAKGLFIMPTYARGGLGVAVRGGEGVMLANNGSQWSSPVFYNFGGISIGAQAGAETGSIAMILMNDKAMNSFMQDHKFSLTADAGLTVVNYTAKAKAQTGRGDVVVWSDTKGAFADVAVGVTDITFDEEENKAWYKKSVAAKDIVSGKVSSGSSNPIEKQLSGSK